jgi:hypothetical protein
LVPTYGIARRVLPAGGGRLAVLFTGVLGSSPVRRAGSILVLSSMIALGACASGPRLLMGQPIKKEVAVLLRVSNDASGDQFGGIAAIAETVTDGLSKRGITNQLYAANDDHPGTPRIEILVTKWSGGDASLRDTGRSVGGLVGGAIAAAGQGKYEVTVNIYRDGDAQPICTRKNSGSVDPDDAGFDVSLGESLGSWVLTIALTDTAECRSDDSSDHVR